MNLTALKNFAPAVRRQLIEAVGRKLDFVLTGDTPDLREKAKQRMSIKGKAQIDRPGLIERVAYTWFNRLAALRFLDARGWHPFLCRVITPATEEETQPEILKLTRNGTLPTELGPFTDAVRINNLLDGRIPSADPQGEVYRHLVLAACRYYHKLMPFLFEALDDETELLLPDDLLTEHSVAQGFRSAITDDDCAEVEIIGWLYQFYIAEKKDQVMASKGAVHTDDIPAITQLFTPHWIVRYLVENSLGRLWLLNRPGSRLRNHMPYYIEGESEVDFLKISKPEEICLLDPATGSGHILTYSFDLLYLIYEEEGHAPSEIPGLILRHNLFGLEICPRATQLAQFALICKAREKSRIAFRKPIQPQVMCLEDVDVAMEEMSVYLRLPGLRELFTEKVLLQIHQFHNTAAFGSLLRPVMTAAEITTLQAHLSSVNVNDDLLLQQTHIKVLLALNQAKMLSQRYNVVVENPPYCGSRYMNADISRLAKNTFKAGSGDMFAMFILRSMELVKQHGYIGVVCPFVWMFIATYEAFRRTLLTNGVFRSMVRLEYNAFEPACVPVSAWIYARQSPIAFKTQFIDLSKFKGIENQSPKTLEAIDNPSVPFRHSADCSEFLQIPSAPFAYSISSSFRRVFSKGTKLSELVEFTGSQNKTGKNSQYVRLWWEVGSSVIGQGQRWVFYAKGGGNRKWWGLLEDVVDWSKEAREFYQKNKTSNLLDQRFWFRTGITYSELTSNQSTFRVFPTGAIYDMGGPVFHPIRAEESELLLSLCNSPFAERIFDVLNPTMHLKVHDVKSLPVVEVDSQAVIKATNVCVNIARADWDNFETSWDFHDQPLLRNGLKKQTLEKSWEEWATYLRRNISLMKELETMNNRLWIEAYGLQEELTPEVPEVKITLARPDRRKDLATFLSYAVGCMMGRYSLDKAELILADSGDTLENYMAKIGRTPDQFTFAPDNDGIIPMLDGEWFEDDIVARTRDFLRATFGEATLEENLRFIEESLGKDLRKYFLNDFFKDHLQTYEKRPIYWLFQSPKKGFSALVYLHRYTRDTVNVLLNGYLRDYLHKLRSRIEHLEHIQAISENAREKTAARKESDTLKKTLRECEEYEREIILPLAQQRIELDLDDGVKVNYLKFGKALAPIPGLASKETDG